jgi:hypothetical protein
MKKERRAPDSGYESEAKKEYRKEVWDAILKDGVHGKILVLPSKEGYELDHLILDRKIPQSQIIAIDENPALIASAPWRKKYKSVKCYGCKVSEVHKRLKGVTIGAANLDLCNNFSEELVSEVATFLQNAPLNESDFVFSVTVSKGREQTVTNYLLNYIMDSDRNKRLSVEEKRIACLMKVAIPDGIYPWYAIGTVAQGKYINNKTPMAWAVVRFSRYEDSALFKPLYKAVEIEAQLFGCFAKHLTDEYNRISPDYKTALMLGRLDGKITKASYPELYDVAKEAKEGRLDLALSFLKCLEAERKLNQSMYSEVCEKYEIKNGGISRWCSTNGGISEDLFCSAMWDKKFIELLIEKS